MKDLITFLKEALEDQEVNEASSDYKFVKFTFGEDAPIEDIKSACSKADVYYEDVDSNTIKIKVRKGKDFSGIEDIVKKYINDIPEDKKDESEDIISKLNKSLDKINSFINDDIDQSDDKDDKEDVDKNNKDKDKEDDKESDNKDNKEDVDKNNKEEE